MTGPELRALRKKMKINQAQLGERLELSTGWIGEMERGQKPIARRTAYAVRYLALVYCLPTQAANAGPIVRVD